ncbi:Ras-related protein Rab-28 [Cryptotermes secundus]|uniref:Ras-related protein Rab-28 n=1 Tax=Cryptotermes secundus TaxID=105785 RepID=A0A2J7PI70_9NEOP|nr:ras-related protein Rab-28 [Cryptotermes secundus]PNF16037.1 Ras-related protein Rab-28 [Cryptotermes secundus]
MSDSEDEAVEKQLKIVVVGEAGSGKTCLASRYCHDEFTRQYFPTAGVDFFLKRTVLSGAGTITLQIWDVGGQSLAGNMLDKYIFGADVILLVFDITNPVSFDSLEEWLDMIRRTVVSQEHQPKIAVVANKCDLEHKRKVRPDRQHKFTQENGLGSHVVSARTGEMVALSFHKVVAEVLGLKLSRAEQEEQQPLMQAEILHSPTATTLSDAHCPAASHLPSGASKSAICEIQ